MVNIELFILFGVLVILGILIHDRKADAIKLYKAERKIDFLIEQLYIITNNNNILVNDYNKRYRREDAGSTD